MAGSHLVLGDDIAELFHLGLRQLDIQRCHILLQVFYPLCACMETGIAIAESVLAAHSLKILPADAWQRPDIEL